MAERCPLGRGLSWDASGDVPEFCIENCQSIWEKKALGKATYIDTFASDCSHDVENNDQGLERLGGSARLYFVLNNCMEGCGEAFSEQWQFDCPKE